MSVSSICTGEQAGTIIVMSVGGALASSTIGWPAVSYTFGAVGFFWVVCWFFLGADRPGTHKFISKEEQAYIETNLRSKVSTDKVCGSSHLYVKCKVSTAAIRQD